MTNFAINDEAENNLPFFLANRTKDHNLKLLSMNSLRTTYHAETVNVLWTDGTGMLICAALGSRLSDQREAFPSGPGGVKNIAM